MEDQAVIWYKKISKSNAEYASDAKNKLSTLVSRGGETL